MTRAFRSPPATPFAGLPAVEASPSEPGAGPAATFVWPHEWSLRHFERARRVRGDFRAREEVRRSLVAALSRQAQGAFFRVNCLSFRHQTADIVRQMPAVSAGGKSANGQSKPQNVGVLFDMHSHPVALRDRHCT